MKLSRKVDSRPAFQFYPDLWLTDAGLMACSLAAQGLWINLLCYMWHAQIRGIIHAKGMQALCRADATTFNQLLEELVNNQVCEVGENNAIISRKMHREFLLETAIKEKCRKAANARWHAQSMQKHGSSSSTTYIHRENARKTHTKNGRFAPPSFEDVLKYCLERNNQIDARNFIDFYESKGWLIGKSKMKDWRAAIRTWENRKESDRPKELIQKFQIIGGEK